MKRIFAILLISLLLYSCSQKGQIADEPRDFININGKIYKIMSVYPCDGCNYIWIMYPKDSLGTVPQMIAQPDGKITRTIVKIDE